MTREELGTRVRAVISDHLKETLGDEAAAGIELTDGSKLVDDLGFDSLDMVEIVMRAEDAFELQTNLDVPGEDIGTVGGLITFLAGKLGIVDDADPESDICSVCAKPIPPGSPVRYYDDVGEVHAICGGATPEQAVDGGRIPADPDEFSGDGPPPEYVEVYLSGTPRRSVAA